MAIKRSHNSPPAAEENLLTPNPTIEETEKAEAQIRPQSLEDYIGQQDLKANLKVTIAAAKARQEAIDHLLFYGPPGLGKTTMALILAAEMGVNCRITAAPALERPRDITGILINLQPRDILFIDEIHRLNRVTEELLYPAMEDYRLDVTIGKGQAAKIRSISLPPFTLIGATTKVGSLTSPLRDRFGMIQRLRFYTVEELTTIILRSATIFNIPMTEAGAIEIARRGRGTPRIANRLLKRVRDYVQVKGETMITPQLAAEGLNQLNVDSMGLDWTDRLVLKTMIEQFQGRPVGLEAVAAATGEDAKTIEEVYEPYLLQIGYLNRTARGRVVTAAAYEHLGLLAKLPKNNYQSLPLFEL
ncbi:MAG: Holliday junction branch migration DNA helicase RuvB [Microcystis wesenbergii TW10]|jgi:Holliday junction DNA helicase RuvB|uniref:Holliday junction branch migration complex subunit RuvB n=2 Tax=Microcystis TaxID=1125 RepID=A0A0A1VT72_MICAE|nr:MULTISPECIES: Holliday junction branch migration DNA helicase RuvB [Microcystis]REJ53580.1 MAG: Holliday junction branch migration DNA helicase RuvB [Microcystis wesenbergii TW10]MBD2116509.1 Holliday junction branch migration DNA helicase RuvB [Microcystis wesenbergii FACHB-1339]MCZ8040675.1 Holliday junction branch migration DNA helicase RuvB [Microcystis sp. LE17-20A]MCZ8212056.1 Holliday junction branch migration DNA helicase RuvB [Microcystis sp. LE19-8.1F]GAL92668.1 holliday junction 